MLLLRLNILEVIEKGLDILEERLVCHDASTDNGGTGLDLGPEIFWGNADCMRVSTRDRADG